MIRVLLTRDFKRILQDPITILFLLALPLVITLVARSVFAPGGKTSFVVPLAYVDQDETVLTGFLDGMMQNEEMRKTFDVTKMDLEPARARLRDNEIAGILVVPAGFTSAYTGGEKAQLKLITNPARPISSMVLESTFGVLTELLDGLREAFPDLIGMLGEDKEIELGPLFEMGKTAMDRIEARRDQIFQFPFTFKTAKREQKEDSAVSGDVGMVIAFMPGMAFMAVLFVIASVFRKFTRDLEEGLVRRMLATPATLNQLLFSLVLQCLILVASIQIILWLASLFIFDLQVVHMWALVQGILYMALMATLLNAAVYMLPFRQRVVEAVSSIAIILVCLFSGLLVSPMMMPPGIRALIERSPFYLPVKNIINAFLESGTLGSLKENAVMFGGLVVLLLLAMLMFRFTIMRYRKGTA